MMIFLFKKNQTKGKRLKAKKDQQMSSFCLSPFAFRLLF